MSSSPPSPAFVSSGDYFAGNSNTGDSPPSSDMLGTPKAVKSTTGVTKYSQTLQTSELNRLSWEKEIEGKVSVFDKPVDEFLDVFVPGPGASRRMNAERIKDAFGDVPVASNETEKYPDLIQGLKNLVDAFAINCRPAFGDGSHCNISFPFEAWGKEQHYTMPDIVMSLPGKCKFGWESAWKGISTVFEVKRDQREDPVHEGLAYIRTGSPQRLALVQIAKSARNLLHTHSLLYAYVVGIYNHKARIYRFDHAAGVVSKEIDLKADPFPLFDFLWRFCNYQHSDHGLTLNARPAGPASGPQTRSMTKDEAGTGSFLGMDPTITAASKTDSDKVNELLKTSDPPQDPLSQEEKDACRWVSVVSGYNSDGSAGPTKRYLVYRLRFLNPRLFSRATRVWDAYEVQEGGRWERRAIKDAWRQLARDREDVLYRRLRDGLRQHDDLEKLVEECKKFGLPSEDVVSDADDTRSEAAPPSTAADDESVIHELNDAGTPILADELATCGPSFISLYGLPDVETGDDLGAREALKLFDRKHGNTTRSRRAPVQVHPPPSEADLDSLAQGATSRPPAYDVYHRTICAWLRDKAGAQEARFDERSHMRLVMKTVGRPLSTFRSTKEMVTAIRDAIIGHMLAFKAGLVHRDMSDGNVVIMDNGPFSGFLLDLDYAFNWMEALRLASEPGEEVSEEAWAALVKNYDKLVRNITRPAPAGKEPPVFVKDPARKQPRSTVDSRLSWTQRMKMKERTGTLFFMAIQVLTTYVAHDVQHDLESAVWLLLCMVLRHTIQVMRNDDDAEVEYARYHWYRILFKGTTEEESATCKRAFLFARLPWEVKGNQPLTGLILSLRKLVIRQNRDTEEDEDQPAAVMTYKSVLTEINRALALPGWPENDAALPFTLSRDGSSSASESQDRKRPREEDNSELHANSNSAEGVATGSDTPRRPAKKPLLGPSPLRHEVERNASA